MLEGIDRARHRTSSYQVAVDTDSRVVVAQLVSNNAGDRIQLKLAAARV